MVPVGKKGNSTVRDLQPYLGMAYSSESLGSEEEKLPKLLPSTTNPETSG